MKKFFMRLVLAIAFVGISAPTISLASQVFNTYATTTPPGLSGVTLATTLNSNEDALRSSFQGASSPSTPDQGQLWYDSTNSLMKYWTGSAWNPLGGGGLLGTSVSSTAPARSGEAGTGIYTPGSGQVGIGITGTAEMMVTGAGIAIGSTTVTSGAVFDLSQSTNSMILPAGTSAQRPTGVANMFRSNTTIGNLEVYLSSKWQTIGKYGDDAMNVMQSPWLFATDGTTDMSTTAATAYAANLPSYHIQSVNGTAMKAVSVGNYANIQGSGTPQYLTTGQGSKVVVASGGTNILNFGTGGGAANFVTISGMDYMGAAAGTYNSTVTCLDGAPSTVYLINSSFRFCGKGVIGSTSNYVGTIRSFGSQFYGSGNQNNAGAVTNPVDSQFVGGAFTANYDGIQISAGANQNMISDETRFEYDNHAGVTVYQAQSNNIGGNYDRNAYAGVILTQAGAQVPGVSGKSHGTLVHGVYTRNATGNTTGQDAHILSNGGNYNSIYSDIITAHDCGDSGCGTTPPNTPKYAFDFPAQTGGGFDFGVRIGTGDYNGYTVAPINWNGGGYPFDFGVWNALGISPSVAPYESDFYGAITLQQVPTPAIGTITTAGTAGSTTDTYKAVCNVAPSTGGTTPASAAVSITTANATLTTTNYNIIPITTPCTGGYFYKIYRTAAGGTPSTTGLIGTMPASENIFWDTGLAGDSTTAPTTNTTGQLLVGTTTSQAQTTAPIQSVVSAASAIAPAIYIANNGGAGTVSLQFGTYNSWQNAAPASITGVDDNFSNDVVIRNKATGGVSGTDSGTANFAVSGACVLGMPCLLGELKSANFNVTTDQTIPIRPMTSGSPGYISGATNYFITEIDVVNCSASPGTAAGAFYTATSKGGTVIGTTVETFTNCTSSSTRQRFTSITNMDTTTLTGTNLYLSLTTAKGSAGTGDVYVYGIPYN